MKELERNGRLSLLGVREALRSFFMGKYYPVAVAVLTLLSHCLGLEIVFGLFGVFLISVALLICDTARPAVPFVVFFVFLISVKNAPGIPTYSNYLFTGARLVFIIIFGAFFLFSAVYFALKNEIFKGMSLKNTRMLIPLLVLSTGFILNGAFSSGFSLASFVYGLMQALCYSVIFLYFAKGLRKEEPDGLLSYFTYVSMLLALTLLLELLHLYIFGGVISEGSIVKEKLLFGWGIWNTAGVSLAVLIPVVFLGVIRGKHPYLYLSVTLLTAIGVVFTMSRNALLFGGAATLICFLVGSVKGENKRRVRYTLFASSLAILFATVIFREKITEIFSDFINRGFSDNGRFELWKEGWDAFLKAPVFGSGFFDFSSDLTFDVASFLPKMAHQTFIQLLSCMGIFGLLCYLYYRWQSLVTR